MSRSADMTAVREPPGPQRHTIYAQYPRQIRHNVRKTDRAPSIELAMLSKPEDNAVRQ